MALESKTERGYADQNPIRFEGLQRSELKRGRLPSPPRIGELTWVFIRFEVLDRGRDPLYRTPAVE